MTVLNPLLACRRERERRAEEELVRRLAERARIAQAIERARVALQAHEASSRSRVVALYRDVSGQRMQVGRLERLNDQIQDITERAQRMRKHLEGLQADLAKADEAVEKARQALAQRRREAEKLDFLSADLRREQLRAQEILAETELEDTPLRVASL